MYIVPERTTGSAGIIIISITLSTVIIFNNLFLSGVFHLAVCQRNESEQFGEIVGKHSCDVFFIFNIVQTLMFGYFDCNKKMMIFLVFNVVTLFTSLVL